MRRIEIEAFEDATRPGGGHAVILLRGVGKAADALRIAVSANLGSLEIDAEVARVFAAAVAVLADLGARLEYVDPPIGQSGSVFARTWFPAASRLIEKFPPEARDLLDPGLAAMAEQGARYSRAEIQDAALERGEIGVAMQRFLGDYDLLVTPTLALPAFAAGVEYPDPDQSGRWSDWAGFSYPFNLTQQPAITVPAGFSRDGLPIGLQIVAQKYADALVLRAARAFETACPQPMADRPRGTGGAAMV